jgi:hypothetical protein
MTQGILLLALISAIGLLGLLGAIFDWEWIYRSRGSKILTNIVGRPAMRVLTGVASVVFIVGPWFMLLTR